MERVNLLNLTYKELEEFVVSLGMKKFNAKQIFVWLHQKIERKIENMTNISLGNRELLAEKSYIPFLETLKHQSSKVDHTEKFLFQLEDKRTIETVLIKHKDRNTLCISSQVGCPVKCPFCATGQGGLERNLNLDEIVNQVYTVNRRLRKKGSKINNIVYMGMGEPFYNLDSLIKSIEIFSSKEGLEISKRKITVSTSGVITGIEKLLELRMPVGLAISLHSAINETRDELIPVNKKYPLEDLFTTLREYQNFTGRRITFEYILLKDVNVSPYDAKAVADFVLNFEHVLNLIPYNTVEGASYGRPGEKKTDRFYYGLKELGVNVTIRGEKGSDIDGACGQLRSKKK